MNIVKIFNIFNYACRKINPESKRQYVADLGMIVVQLLIESYKFIE